MPQLSPMSWVLVVSLVLVCLTFFMTVTWWWVTTKYSIKHPSKKKYAKHSKKIIFKWSKEWKDGL
uniref:ATP synthase F0 subunit 8 n=1 Tax=Utterbackia peninsularis TaxID=872316 RepID=F4ZG95_9BIVA|nr:ATP synthase F0 subunit 8 [Utterbackia peninsularis]